MHNSLKKILSKPNMAWLVALGILLGASVLRWFWLIRNPIPSRDGILYIQMMQEWFANGSGDLFGRSGNSIPPLYLFCGRLVMEFGLTAKAAGQFVSMACGILALIPLWRSALLLFRNQGWALAAMAAGAVSPYAVRSSTEILRDSMSLFLFMLFFYLVLKMLMSEKFPIGFFLGAAVIAASAILVRLECLEMLPILAAAWGWRLWKSRLYGRYLLLGAGGAVVFFAILFVWLSVMKIPADTFLAVYCQRGAARIPFF